MEQTLAEAKATKKAELLTAADIAYVEAWGNDDGVPYMRMDWCLHWAPLEGRTLSARNQQAMADARAVYNRLWVRLDAVRDATTVQQVTAVQW